MKFNEESFKHRGLAHKISTLFLLMLSFIQFISAINLENLIKLELTNTSIYLNTASIIIEETILNNPKSSNVFLPTLPKIITKPGLLCDFPFVLNSVEYYDHCALLTDEKYYCKVSPEGNLKTHELKAKNQ